MAKLIKSWVLVLVALATAVAGLAQGNNEAPQMADGMRSNGKIYVVVTVLVVILLGIALYLVRLDRKVSKLEKNQ